MQLFTEERWPDAPRPLVAAVTVVTALVLSDVSLRLVEGPLRLRSGWAARPRLRRGAWASGAMAVVAALALVAVTVEAPLGIEAVSTEDSAELALRPPPTTASTTTTTTAPPATTVAPAPEPAAGTSTAAPSTAAPTTAPPPPPPARLRLVVIGDSVAFSSTFVSGPVQLHPAGIEVADGRGLIGCWLLSGDGWLAYGGRGDLKRPHPLCAQQREAEQLGLSAGARLGGALRRRLGGHDVHRPRRHPARSARHPRCEP